MKWCAEHFKGKSLISLVRRLILNSFIHHIRRERNSRIFTSKYSSIETVSYNITHEVWLKMSAQNLKTEDNAANREFIERWRFDCTFIVKSPIPCKWLAPKGYDVMINTDGSMNEDSAGFGAILRDTLGDPSAASYGGSPPTSVIKHELQGVEMGLQLAIKITNSLYTFVHRFFNCLFIVKQ